MQHCIEAGRGGGWADPQIQVGWVCFEMLHCSLKGMRMEQGIQEVKSELSLPSSPAQAWGTSGWGSMQAKEQEGILHSKPRASNTLLG